MLRPLRAQLRRLARGSLRRYTLVLSNGRRITRLRRIVKRSLIAQVERRIQAVQRNFRRRIHQIEFETDKRVSALEERMWRELWNQRLDCVGEMGDLSLDPRLVGLPVDINQTIDREPEPIYQRREKPGIIDYLPTPNYEVVQAAAPLFIVLFLIGWFLFLLPAGFDFMNNTSSGETTTQRGDAPIQPLTSSDAEESDSDSASGSFAIEGDQPVVNVEQPSDESASVLCVDNGGVQWQGETCVCAGFIDQVTICNDGTKLDNVTTTACTPDPAACAGQTGGGDGSGGDGSGGGTTCQMPSGGCAEGWVWFQESCSCQIVN